MKLGFGLFAYAALGVIGFALVMGLLFLPDDNPVGATADPPAKQAPVHASP